MSFASVSARRSFPNRASQMERGSSASRGFEPGLQCDLCDDEDAKIRTSNLPSHLPQPPPSSKTARPATFTIKKPAKPSKFKEPVKIPSLSNSGLNFLGEGHPCLNPNARMVRYNEGVGTSFGLHLLRKSAPMVGQNLHKKFKFKRDSDAEAVLIDEFQKRLGLTRPEYFEHRDSVGDYSNGEALCPPRYNKGAFKLQRLTKEQIKSGLLFIQATNSPHNKKLTSSEIQLIQKQAVQDTCGRITHHPKAKGREICKRLCEAPSMTKELDELYQDYFERCAEGNEKSEECQLLHHVAPPNRREPRKSILKDPSHMPRLSRPTEEQGKRRSSFKPHLVKFEKNIEVMTKITKVPGMEEALEDQVEKLKPKRQIWATNGPVGHVPIYPPANIPKQEIFPLHVKDPEKWAPEKLIQIPAQMAEEEAQEDKQARQDLARIYFTHEASKIVACSALGIAGKNPLVRKEVAVKKRSLPHFFMDRLLEDKEKATHDKKMEKVRALKSEMDAFDDDIFRKLEDPPTQIGACSTFDPMEAQPTEKSLINLKLKVEILKRQRERDVQAATERNRCRKAYFQQKILPLDFPKNIDQQLRDFVYNREPVTLSIDEIDLRDELDEVVQKCKIFDEHRMAYDREHLRFSPGKTVEFCREIATVLMNVAVECSEYKALMEKKPTEEILTEWKKNFSAWVENPKCETAEAAATSLDTSRDLVDVMVEVAMNKSDFKAKTGEEPLRSIVEHWTDTMFASWLTYPECNNDIDAEGSSGSTRQAVNGIMEGLLEITFRISEYKSEHGDEPSRSLVQDWRDKFFSSMQGASCDPAEEETVGNLAKNIMDVLLDCVERISDYRIKTGMNPPENLCHEWREQLFAAVYENECACEATKEESPEDIAQLMLDVILDTVIKASNYRYHMKQEAPSCLTEEWRDEIFAEIQGKECRRDHDYSNEQMIKDVLEVIQEIKKSDYYVQTGEKAEEMHYQEWREYYYKLMSFIPCRASPQDEEARLTEVLIRDILDEIVDNVAKISECKEKGDDISSDSSCLLWKERGFMDKEGEMPPEETQYQHCVKIMQETDEMIREIIDEIVDAAVAIGDCKKSPDNTCKHSHKGETVQFNIPSPPETIMEDWKSDSSRRLTLTLID